MTEVQYLPHFCRKRKKKTMSINHTAIISINYTTVCFFVFVCNFLRSSTVRKASGESRFCRHVNEVFRLLGCYAALIFIYRRFGTTYRSDLLETLISPIFNGPAVPDLEDDTDTVCRNVGTQLPINVA